MLREPTLVDILRIAQRRGQPLTGLHSTYAIKTLNICDWPIENLHWDGGRDHLVMLKDDEDVEYFCGSQPGTLAVLFYT